jgi:rRNA maturation endonuclease Nob1
MSGEQWECQQCFRVAELDQHGRCDRCGSNQVFPVAKVLITDHSCEQEKRYACNTSNSAV